MSNHTGHYIHSVAKGIEDMDPVKDKKNPLVAAIIGFLFGPAGVGLYFGNWKDFFVCLVALIGLFILIPGLGVVPGWLFSAGYGFLRASSSNEKNGY